MGKVLNYDDLTSSNDIVKLEGAGRALIAAEDEVVAAKEALVSANRRVNERMAAMSKKIELEEGVPGLLDRLTSGESLVKKSMANLEKERSSLAAVVRDEVKDKDIAVSTAAISQSISRKLIELLPNLRSSDKGRGK